MSLTGFHLLHSRLKFARQPIPPYMFQLYTGVFCNDNGSKRSDPSLCRIGAHVKKQKDGVPLCTIFGVVAYSSNTRVHYHGSSSHCSCLLQTTLVDFVEALHEANVHTVHVFAHVLQLAAQFLGLAVSIRHDLWNAGPIVPCCTTHSSLRY